jgi:hypothetical protein
MQLLTILIDNDDNYDDDDHNDQNHYNHNCEFRIPYPSRAVQSATEAHISQPRVFYFFPQAVLGISISC